MISNNIKFNLFSNCIPVKGYSGSIICDLQKNHFIFIPNDLYEILEKYSGRLSIAEIKKKYQNQYDEVIDEYFDFLISNEYIFFTNDTNFFPKLSTKFIYPFEISNAIIDVGKSTEQIIEIIDSLDELNCKFLEIRSFKKDYNLIMNVISYITKKKYFIRSINILLPFEKSIQQNDLENMMIKFRRITSFYIYNSPSEIITKPVNGNTGFVYYTKKTITSQKDCGSFNTYNFSTNIKCFTESLHHNSCLHKKISIDSEGNIRNCPSMPQSFGNIKDTTLEEALAHPDFKKYWNLTKDHIEVCKDCEFRYICTDCRAYTERTHKNAEGLDTSKPLKCGYNPYTGEWEEWSTNPLKQKAIKYYGMQDLVKK